MTQARPRVVLFRHAPVDFDSRAKRIAGTLHRNGFEPVIISVEPAGGAARNELLDGVIPVLRVPLAHRPQPLPPVAKVDPKQPAIDTRRRRRDAYAERISGPNAASIKAALRYAKLSVELAPHDVRQAVSDTTDTVVETAQTWWDDVTNTDPFRDLDLAGTLAIADHLDYTLTDLLVALRPDILHAHHPYVLPAAAHAAQALRAGGHPVAISYDIREDFAGLPEQEIGARVAHDTMLEVQRRFMPMADYVTSVNEEIAQLVTERYRLDPPAVAMRNYPRLAPMSGSRTVRDAVGVGPDVPLIVYSGVMSRARGMDTLIAAMAHVPAEAQLAIVTMPLPHPLMPELIEQATELGVADRVHFVPAVDQSELIHYLHGADVAVHPMPGGSPNHDQAMPNKLFEYLHARLTFVCSDAKTLARFVTENDMGRVFRSHDAADLGAQLTAALADPVPQEHLARLAERYSWQANEEQLVRAFRGLAADAGEQPRGRAALVKPERIPQPAPDLLEPPHVVLFRHAPIDIDTRVKKLALTLHRGGYRVTVISVEPVGAEAREESLGGQVRVLRVPLNRVPAPPSATKVRAKKSIPQRALAKFRRHLPARLRNVRFTKRPAHLGLAPLIADHVHTLSDLLVELKPDILHVHHPLVFEAARHARAKLPAHVRMVYDAREHWAGLPLVERGNLANHAELVDQERAGIVEADGILTVAEQLADNLKGSFHLARRPLVALHYPVEYPLEGSRTVRDAIGVGDDIRLLVYSGVLSRARDLDLLVRGLAGLPDDVHLVLVSVPYPHPQEPELRAVADAAGVAQERLHFAPPVDQHELAHYLSGADIAVSAIPRGSANHDLALPNKLFEYAHARLPLVTADATAMKNFTRKHGTGTVFRSGEVDDYLRAVRQNLESPVPAEHLAAKASEFTWQHQEAAILEFYDRISGFASREPEGDFPPLTVA